MTQGNATVLRGLLDPDLEGKTPLSYASGVATKPRLLEQSGVFLDNCQVLPLPRIDFPAGERSAAALWKLSKELVEMKEVETEE